MKRLRSSEDLALNGEKDVSKDWGRREEDSVLRRSSSQRSFSYKSEGGRKGGSSSSSSRYDRIEDDRETSRSVRKRSEYDVDGYDRRKSYNRYRNGNDRAVISSTSPQSGYGAERIHRSESFSVPRRDFPKGFRSERDRSRREGSVSSWKRFGGGKDGEEGTRSGSESVKVIRSVSGDAIKVKSHQGQRDAKSPPWSKDSSSEQSKSVEFKKSEDLPIESSARSSEREEGELEPDPHPVSTKEPKSQEPASVDGECQTESQLFEDRGNLCSADKVPHKEGEEKGGPSQHVQSGVEEVDKLPVNHTSSTRLSEGSEKETATSADNKDGKDDGHNREHNNCPDRAGDPISDKASGSKAETSGGKSINLENKKNDVALTISCKEPVGEVEAPGAVSALSDEEITHAFKGNGKILDVSSTVDKLPLTDGVEVKSEQRGSTYQDADPEGSSARGFELFTSHPVKKAEKTEHLSCDKDNDEKLALDLSLSLPNVLLPVGSNNKVQAPSSPSHARSSQTFRSTFRTNSDGFTTSFSGSQNFTHNPSCSLTHNSFDNYEQSVGSRPIFQGVDWQILSSHEHKTKEGPLFQSVLSNGNGLHQKSQASQGKTRQHVVVQQSRVMDGSSKMPVGMERQLSYSKHLSGAQSWHSNGVRSPSQSAGSHDTISVFTKDRKQLIHENNVGSLYRINSSDGKELPTVGADFAESIITKIVSEPMNVLARRFCEMTDHQVAYLKESIRDIILNPGKQWQLSALQKALRNRADITLEMLLDSHQVQLEILVSLKTGLQEYLQQCYKMSSSDLAEIFLNLKCRNITCRNLLPVDECDCRICVQKSGFCSACMCLVCSKFDMASNTCSWVGCDVCLHWCHADCGLQKSYIRNGRSATGAGGSEMQFHCVACNHPSEMFGFVKEVFQNFAKAWTAEALWKELECVKRIFATSEDVRGRRLHEIAIEMLRKLGNKAALHEVQSYIMDFFTDAESFRSGNATTIPHQEFPIGHHEFSNGVAGSSQEAEWLKSICADKAPLAEKPATLFPSFEFNQNEKDVMKRDMQSITRKESVFDELESIVRIKHAEAKMFQGRAEDARREAEALKRIVIMKNERINEEYTARIAKLCLIETEEMRKQKLEELHAVERAYQEYFSMKMRMETDIKDLLLKMEATRINLTK